MNAVVATSPNYAASSPVLAGLGNRLRVIAPGIDPVDYTVDPGRVERWRKRIGEGFCLFIGALRYYKGIEYLLRAAEIYRGPIVLTVQEGKKNVCWNIGNAGN